MAGKRTKNKRSVGYILFILSAAAVLFFAAVHLYNRNLNHEFIYESIYIDDTSVGGLTKNQALELLNSLWENREKDVKIRLIHEEQEWLIDHYDLQLSSNRKQVVDEAYQIGREGGLFSRIRNIYNLRQNPVYLYTELSYNTQGVSSKLQEIAGLLNKEPVDAVLSFDPDREEMFQITREKPGYKLDTNKVLEEIEDRLSKGEFNFSIQLELDAVEPQVFASDFEGKTELLVSFGTDLSGSPPDRTNNVVLAASQFNGLVLQPGEVLSFNGVVGERTAEKGYKAANMITADKSLQPAIGGGVSQTSTTLYNAAIRAGLEVIEYKRHSFPVSYIKKGLDTTVNLPYPEIDIKVRNTKDSPVYFKTFYANKKVYFQIYGEPLPNGRTIRIRTEEYETVAPPPPEIRQDADGRYVTYKDEKYTYVPPRNGYKVRVYREYIEDGKVVETELLDDHYYRPIAGIIYVGVKDRPSQTPDPAGESAQESDLTQPPAEQSEALPDQS